jgi:hypothetical protein
MTRCSMRPGGVHKFTSRNRHFDPLARQWSPWVVTCSWCGKRSESESEVAS